jgi:hypothetical protein
MVGKRRALGCEENHIPENMAVSSPLRDKTRKEK